MTLGEKIKKRRLEIGLTQEHLAGSEITRNMISQIENDIALPSLPTLKKIAERLNTPCGYFLSADDDLYAHLKLEYRSRIMHFFSKKKYKDCIDLIDKVFGTYNDDEIAFLRCEAYVNAAESSMNAGAMQQALRYADKILYYSNKTQFETGHHISVALLIKAISQNPNAPRLEFDEKNYISISAKMLRHDLYHYLIDDVNYSYNDQNMTLHMQAKKMMKQNQFEKAYQLLESIHNLANERPISAYVLWRLYGDMEICARNCRDFESAYRISSKRLSLSTAFQT